jgi:hypothetical protein
MPPRDLSRAAFVVMCPARYFRVTSVAGSDRLGGTEGENAMCKLDEILAHSDEVNALARKNRAGRMFV